MKRKKDYRSKVEKFFLEYLPTEVFDSLKPKERENYQKYRTHHRYIFEGNQQINKLEKEISKLKDKIKVKKLQINGDDENSGWKQKMMIGYEGVQKLSKDYKFNISIGFRYRKSKILKNEENYESGKVGTKKDLRNQSTFKGETLKSNPLLYLRITRTKDVFKNLYVGKEEDVRLSIGRIYKEDWSKESVEDVKDEIRVIYSTYVRYHVFHSNWGDFFNKKHTLSDVEYWSTEMGDKRWDW